MGDVTIYVQVHVAATDGDPVGNNEAKCATLIHLKAKVSHFNEDIFPHKICSSFLKDLMPFDSIQLVKDSFPLISNCFCYLSNLLHSSSLYNYYR